MGGRRTTAGQADAILDSWFTTEFDGGRHARRVDKIMKKDCQSR
jgi:ribose 5-phosphate isomerase B